MTLRGVMSLFGVSVVGLVALAALIFYYDLRQPEIILTLLVISGVVILLAALGGLVALLRGFGAHDRREALGLPQGSIRAVIALSLILIFAMVSVFLVGAMRGRSTFSIGLTEEQVAQFDVDRIVTILPGESPDTFDVELVSLPSETAQQLSQQLLTILGTLVTALAAFYFGQHSVTTAASAMETVGRAAGRRGAGAAGAVVGGAAGAAAGAAAGGAAGASAADGSSAGAELGGVAGRTAGAGAGEAAGAAAADAAAGLGDSPDLESSTPDAASAAADAASAAADAASAAADADAAATDAGLEPRNRGHAIDNS